MPEAQKTDKANILVFAPERVGLTAPGPRIEGSNFDIGFEPLSTKRRFNEYDGVVVFQRTFEDLTYFANEWRPGWRHNVLTDELDRRTNEAALLLGKGGFLCFVLHKPLVDSDRSQSFETTDLVKRYLRGPSFYRRDLNSRVVNLKAEINEFERFLKLFGGAHTWFECLPKATSELEIRALARVGEHIVGMVFGSHIIFVPSMLPTWGSDVAQEYFHLLIDASLATLKKLQAEVPEWARELRFEEEAELAAKKKDLSESLATIETRLELLSRMRRVLVSDSAALVADVGFVLENGLGFQIEAIEDFKEDLRILSDDRNSVLMLCEIKGVNRGVKREHINQADNHRERADLSDEFPTLLIVNTVVKSARNLLEKDQAIDPEQVRHAVRNRVLILRTLDLLYLARLRIAERISDQEVRQLMFTQVGWLKVDTNSASIER